MDISSLEQISDYSWRLPCTGKMRVPGVIYADKNLLLAMDDRVLEQVRNVAMLPGIVEASYAMPDAHWGYGFPIGGVAAFDADQGGVISAGGVGFDISCAVRTLTTGLRYTEIEPKKRELADILFQRIPAGLGSTGKISLTPSEIDEMLLGGARWAVEKGYGKSDDLLRIEEQGCMPGADPSKVSERAKIRQRKETGSLGSGNHYAELQEVAEIYDETAAIRFGLKRGEVVFSIHCGSRGLGHQIGTDYLKTMVVAARDFGIELPDRELACAPIHSELGQAYLGAMRAGINCALANRQVITHLVREAVTEILPNASLEILYDVSHNTCKVEQHNVRGEQKTLYVHRKGATRALGPGNMQLPAPFREVGQPVLVGGSMGTWSYVLAGNSSSESLSFSSACHGAGRSMSRTQATKHWHGREVVDTLRAQGILIRSPSMRGVAEEAPGAYKDVSAVVEATEMAGLARRVARLRPILCIKG